MPESKSLITLPLEPEYELLVNNISTLWQEAKNKAALAVNSELLMANWHTGQYIVEFEQGGKAKAEYGKQLLVNLAKDLTLRNGRGFSRSNLTYMRKFIWPSQNVRQCLTF